ncbi:hypothetical protein [Brucella intermedia]|uniref:hypothetical protein n=1 Tax=Brucella intermedia TaxID=94625 RepID=UPI0012D2A781|nr:hypothetical protein [Brucella intermedia]
MPGNIILRKGDHIVSVIDTATGSRKTIEEFILSIPPGQRPNPSAYMSQAEIDSQLALFNDGAVRFFTSHPSGTIGPENSFVFPKMYLEELYRASGGNMRAVEKKLGLPSGYLDNVQAAVIERPNVQIPSGNEAGALPGYWVPGGYTAGGVPEAVIPGQIKADDVIAKSAGDLFNGK